MKKLTLAAALLLSVTLFAQTFNLVKEINTTATQSGVFSPPFCKIDNTVFFVGTDGLSGAELWKYDVLSSTASLVKDILPGSSGSGPTLMTDANGVLYFQANDGINGPELWRSDGTSAGTYMIKNIAAGNLSASITSFFYFNGTVYFPASNGTSGVELWKTDGTEAGTVMVKEINVGTGSAFSTASPNEFIAMGSFFYFPANNGTTNGRELWKSDGTEAGTVMVKDIWPGSSGSINFHKAAYFNNKIFFAASNGTSANGTELWATDGTDAGTVMVKDIAVGTANANPNNLIEFKGTLFFSASSTNNGTPDLWKTNGSNAGTVMVRNLAADGIGLTIGFNNANNSFTIVGSKMFFNSISGNLGAELCVTDSTTAGTYLVKDIYPGPGSSSPLSLTSFGGKLYFSSLDITNASGRRLFVSDGTNAGTYQVATGELATVLSLTGGSLLEAGSHLYFAGSTLEEGIELWRTDGTSPGTTIAADINLLKNGTQTSATGLFGSAVLNGVYFFAAADDDHGMELWKSDGTAAGTVMVKDINPGKGNSGPLNFFAYNGFVYFSAGDNIHGSELWKTDGTAAGTVMIKDIWSGSFSSTPSRFVASNGKIFFTAEDDINGRETWITDGTAAGTSLIADITPGITGGNNAGNDFVTVGNYGYHIVSSGRLYKADGFANTFTEFSSDITFANDLGVSGNTLYTIGRNAANQTNLWKSENGAAPVLVKIISTTVTSNYQITSCNGKIYFNGNNGSAGQEPWVSDGTADGTYMIKDINPGFANSTPYQFTESNGKVYFQASSAANDFELWATDGTAASTYLVKDIFPGSTNSSFPSGMIAKPGGGVLFVANDGVNGVELWKSNGFATSTNLLQSFNAAGDGFVSPGRFLNFSQDYLLTKLDDGNSLIFFARSADKGLQLYSGSIASSRFYVNDNSLANDVYTTAIGNNANNGTLSSPFATISYAVSQAAEGDTIYADAGTYTEQVTLDKGITIIGAGKTITIIQPPPPPHTIGFTVGGTNEYGVVQTTAGIGNVVIEDLTVDGTNQIFDNNAHGILLQTSGRISRCEVKNMKNPTSYGGNTGSGIYIWSTNAATIKDTVENCSVYNFNYLGVFAVAPSYHLTVINNDINATGALFGMCVYGLGVEPGGPRTLTVTNNKISGFNGWGVRADGNTSAIVSNNSITGVAGLSINSINNPTTVQANCNWYGSATEYDIITKLSSAVQYIPWLTNGTDNDVAVGFQPVANVCNGYPIKLYVNDNNLNGDIFTTAVGSNTNPGTTAAPFATLDHAISIAKNGDTIYVDAGTYIENVIINKSLVLRGAKFGQNPQGSLNRGGESIFYPAFNLSGLNGNAIVFKTTANDITIDGFTIDGDNPAIAGGQIVNGVDCNAGVAVFNDNVFINNLTVINTIVKNTSGYGIGQFKALGNTSLPVVSGALFKNNHVHNIGSRGIVLAYNAVGQIEDNHITQINTSGIWIAQQNISNSAGTLIRVTGNTISAGQLGVQLSAMQGANPYIEVMNNDITMTGTNGFGLSAIGFSPGALFSNNKVSGGLYGAFTNSPSTRTIHFTNNSFTGYISRSIENTSSTINVIATCNWYGSAAEDDIKTKVSSSVQYIPWLTDGTDNDAATGFQPVANTCNGYPRKLYVNDNSTTGDVFTATVGYNTNPGTALLPFGSIDFAYNVAKSGDTIFVDAGTYDLGGLSYAFPKSIVILGTNYQVSPNDATNKLLPNAARNAETILSNGTIAITSNNLSFEGITFNPGNRSLITLSNAGYDNFNFTKNKIIIGTGTLINLAGTATTDANLLTASDYLFADNRFEKLASGSGSTFSITYIKNFSIDNNAFVVTGPVSRNQITIIVGSGFASIVDNLSVTNNVVDRPNYNMFSYSVARMTITGNKFYNAQRGLFLQVNYNGSTDIRIEDNLIEHNLPGLPIFDIMPCRIFDGANAANSNISIRNNTINIDGTGLSSLPPAISPLFAATVANPSLVVSGNRISHTGSYNLFSSGVTGIGLVGKNYNSTVENNEVVFTGQNTMPSFVHSGISTGTDGVNGMPVSSVLNFRNNKVSGYKQSIIFYDGTSTAADTYVGYGNLPIGATVNINNNSFTGDSISINNGNIGQSVNASCNWYGSLAESDVLNKVTATVQHIPWLTNGTDNEATTGFQPVSNACNGYPRKLYVNNNDLTGDIFTTAIGNNTNTGTSDAPFATLDFALSVAEPGDSIYVDAGTYSMTDFTITKGVTIIGTNYQNSPNDAVDKRLANTTRNAESVISGAQITIGSSNISFQGLVFDPGAKLIMTMNFNTPTTENYSNISLLKNRFKINLASSQIILAGIGNITTVTPSTLINTGFDIVDNRFEKHINAGGFVFSIHMLKNITIDNNSFVMAVGSIPTTNRLQNIAGFGNGSLVDGITFTNNVVDRANTIISGGRIGNAVFSGNKFYNSNSILAITNDIPQSSTLDFNNNYIESTGGNASFMAVTQQGGFLPGSNRILKIENNTYNATATIGSAALMGSLNYIVNNAVQNPSAIIRGNKFTYTGDFTNVEGQFIRPLQLRGKLSNLTVDNNELTLNGTNLQPKNPANSLPVSPAISLYSDNGTNSMIPVGAVINILNNKVQGFKHSFVIFDALNGSNPFIGFGNLQPGITVNVNNNSFTGDSMSVNTGSVGSSINASCNWYGYTAIQDIAPKLSLQLGNVYTPYLTNGTDNDLAVGFQPAPGTCNGQPIQVNLDSYTNITCNGANNGTISITVFNGFPPYQFTWSKDGNLYATTEDLTNLAPGVYTLTMLDALGSNVILDENGDLFTIEIEITEPDALTASATGSNNLCFAESNGTATVSVGGGTSPYTYLWSNGATTASISNLTAGLYSVTVTDASGCTAQSSYQVTEPALLTASITNNSSGCFNAATVTAAGGTAPYTYIWSNDADTAAISSVPPGTYNVTVTDDNGCTTNASIILAVGEAFNPSASVINVTCFGKNDGVITVTNANGTAPFTFSIDGINFLPGSLPYSFAGLPAGTHTVAVRDANGCTGFVTKTITEPTAIAITVNNIQTTCFAASTGAISASVSGGSPAYSYSWTGLNVTYNSSQLNISNLAAGDYRLTVTDNKGCQKIQNVTVPSYNQISVDSIVTPVICKGDANGTINLTVTGGSGNFGYLWNDGATTEDRINMTPGNKSVTITDNVSGCTTIRTFTIQQSTSLLKLNSPVITNFVGCSPAGLGAILATADGGALPHEFKINNGGYQSSGSFTNLSAGSYTVYVKDAYGCEKFITVQVLDEGFDQYDGSGNNNNNTRGRATPVSLGVSTTARIGIAGDIDYYKLNPINAWAGDYTLTFTQPPTAVTFDLTASNGSAIITPSASSATHKQYAGLNGTYYVRVSGANSPGCYQFTITNSIATRTSYDVYTKGKGTGEPVVEKLSALAFPNPHQGNFTLQVESPQDGQGSVQLVGADGKAISMKNVVLRKGKNNLVHFTNIRHAVLFYRVILGKQEATGKVIGQY